MSSTVVKINAIATVKQMAQTILRPNVGETNDQCLILTLRIPRFKLVAIMKDEPRA